MMFILANFLRAFAEILNTLLSIYFWIVIARAVLSWVNPDPYNPIVSFLYRATEPLLRRIRRVVPYLGGIDVSPIVVLLAIKFLQIFVVDSLIVTALRMRGAGVFP